MEEESQNTTRLEVDGKSIVLVGTAHVSEESADEVERIIVQERPDTVCVELCQSRYQALTSPDDEKQSIGFSFSGASRRIVLPYLLFWYFQKRIGKRLKVQPGREMLRAIEAARANGARLCLVDRDFRTTLERAWRSMGLKTRLHLFVELAASLHEMDSLQAKDIERMKQGEGLERLMDEFARSLPELKRVFIEERDEYMAREILTSGGSRIVTVVGAAHVAGIANNLRTKSNLVP